MRLWRLGTSELCCFFMVVQPKTKPANATGMKPSPGLAPGTVVKIPCERECSPLGVAVVALQLGPDVDVRIGTDDVALRVTNDVGLRRRTSRGIVARRLSHRLEAFGLRGGVRSRRDVASAKVGVVGLGEGRGSDKRGQSHGGNKLIHFHLHSL